ncbi:DUF488 family protein [Candidatus Woesearchaeota archaeon]|nr:DUF488 family protein [Candidatus Woesearchaeota archaeon]
MLFTQNILSPEESYGIRLAVMGSMLLGYDGRKIRLNDGYNVMLQKLAPPPALEQAYQRGQITWDDFSEAYSETLQRPEISDIVRDLAREGIRRDITLVSAEDDVTKSYRAIVAQECKRQCPELMISRA